MTEKDLIENGFKKKKLGDDYWYELKCKKHSFITNDTIRNDRKNVWLVGYGNPRLEDHFWFNENLKSKGEFKIVFSILTGIEFKLAHQRGMINKK